MSEKAWVARDAKDGSRLLFTDEPTVDDKGSFDSIENWCSLLWAENLAAPPDYIAGILPTDLKPGECREIEAPWPADTFADVQEVNAAHGSEGI
ncbi:MAG: hypothetical protein ACLQVA_14555 [Candidatus Brocadiia bacterium]